VRNFERIRRGNPLRTKYLTDAQLQTLLKYVKNKADVARRKGTTRAIVDELIIFLLVNTGLHASEICSLRIADLPMEHGENSILVRDFKGDVHRSVEITSKMAECLERFVRLYRKVANHDEPLMINERGKRLSYMSLYSKVKKIGEKAKIGKLHPHMLRCTYLVRLYDDKTDLRFVQEQAGHASRKTTALYAQMTSDRERQFKAISDNVSSAVRTPGDSSGRSIHAECALQKTSNHRESYHVGGSRQIINCEACDKSISAEAGTKIDSGQILCADCLKELRSHNL
jgi:site-specific recombinase XerD